MSNNSAYQAGLDLPDLEVHPRYIHRCMYVTTPASICTYLYDLTFKLRNLRLIWQFRFDIKQNIKAVAKLIMAAAVKTVKMATPIVVW